MKKKILLAEDNLDAAEVLAKLLRLLGFEVEVTHDGYTAIHIANHSTPDFILLDIGIPDIDGYEAARQIRKNPKCKDSKLIAITGYGQEEDKSKSIDAGFDYHLIKPVGIEELKKILI